MHRYLVNRYCETVHGLYPIIDGALPYLEEPPDSLSALTPSESFVLHMVYSIACHCLPGNDCQLLLLSDVFYRQALVHVERITAELNLEALQAVSLLALRSTFDAQNGNLGQQIAFAHRLEVELSAREVEDTTTPALRRLRTSIFSLGNQVATVLDRPSGLMEPEEAAYFDTSVASQLLCTMYVAQSRFRSGTALDHLGMEGLTSNVDTTHSPLLVAALHETRFLIQPDVESASQLLETYASDDMVLNVFTSHWAYKAATFFFKDSSSETGLQHGVLAHRVLERCAQKWPNARALQDALSTPPPG
ncbi:hypothetical protein ABEF95_011368 [Exophiala dermatitidis]